MTGSGEHYPHSVTERRTIHETIWDGRTIRFEWFPAPALPLFAGRVYGVCTTDEGTVPLVRAGNDPRWFLPGGGVHPGESAEDALARELDEELGARIVASAYLGYQSAHDPDNPFGAPEVDYHLFYWCAVEIPASFASAHEITEVTVVAPDAFLATLSWSDDPKARILLDLALEADRRSR
jgi:8-oxo-dGTP pyrophosphatase MutT (NUDIX family)